MTSICGGLPTGRHAAATPAYPLHEIVVMRPEPARARQRETAANATRRQRSALYSRVFQMKEERVTGTPAGNLTAALVTVAFLELLLNRLATRLFLPGSSIAGERLGSPAARVLIDTGPFLFHLTGVLAFLVLLAAFAGLLRRGELFPRTTRVAVTIIA